MRMPSSRRFRVRLPSPLLFPFVLGLAACGAGGGGQKQGGSGQTGGGGDGQSGSPGLAGGGGNLGEDKLGDRQPDGGCNRLEVGFEEINPTVLLLVDRSGSMFDEPYGGSPDRWEPLRQALVDPASGPVQPLEAKVRWGFMAYTNNGDDAASECPTLSTVPAAFNNFDAIAAEYSRISVRPAFKAETPTGPSVRAAIAALAAVQDPGPKFIILATDGEPDTCAHPDPQCGQDESIAAVQEAFRQGIQTFVVGIGGEVGEKHLRDLANAGVGAPVEPPDQTFVNNCQNPGLADRTAQYATGAPGTADYYRPSDPEALKADLRSIINSVRKCRFDLDAEVDPNGAHLGDVVLDGTELSYDDPNGWHLVDETTLEVLGAACDSVLTSSKRLSVGFPCDVAVPIR